MYIKDLIYQRENCDQFFCEHGELDVSRWTSSCQWLTPLKILRALHPPDSSGISPYDFWIFGDFKGKLRDRHLQDLADIITAFQELWDRITFEEPQMIFESWIDRCAGSLNMTESFVNETFAIRLFHGQGKIGACSHYFSATLYQEGPPLTGGQIVWDSSKGASAQRTLADFPGTWSNHRAPIDRKSLIRMSTISYFAE
jgi:hypothetical protein